MGSFFSLPITLIAALSENGIFYCLYYALTYTYLRISRLIWKARLDLYDFCAKGQPLKAGFFVPQKEWELDTPIKSQCLRKVSDDAFCFGTNSKSEYLAVHVSRRQNGHAQCSLVLQLANGKLYYLPKEHVIQRATSEENTFGSSRLKLQCLIPMRKWRIFFNGMLEEYASSERKFVHVKFTILWTASSDVFDFSCDMSARLLSHTEATHKPLVPVPTFLTKKLTSIFDCYDQPGMFLGTVKVEGEEEREIYLWGSRGRSMGNMSNLKSGDNVEVYGNFENGSVIRLGILNIPGLVDKFAFGYVMRSDGFIHPIDEFDSNMGLSNRSPINITCTAGQVNYSICVDDAGSESVDFRREFNGLSSLKNVNLKMNDQKGKGFVFRGFVEERCCLNFTNNSFQIPLSRGTSQGTFTLTIPFENERCQDPTLSGGKGSSLAKLFALSKLSNLSLEKTQFTLPNGLVVSTEAYQEFTKHHLRDELAKFEKNIWCPSKKEGSASVCQKIVDTVSSTKLPENITQSIKTDLETIFGSSVSDRKFSVRSSATGEDTEQMSAAGQNATFLGVKGIDEILKAVTKCWASQFTFQAVEYKRRYGQHLDTPMAVVIQEMVPCEAAGVMFTCDPVTGNPSFISITANWGLGESVVSGSSEPDTITLRRNIHNKLEFDSQLLGSKKSRIIMDENFGTKEIDIAENESANCCISEDNAMRLGCVAIEIEESYGSPQDIEWGIADNNVFLFQSRPVTSVDIDTDFETKHFNDSYHRIENEFLSKANVGEVMPGATSQLGLDIMTKSMDILYPRDFIRTDGEALVEKPYFFKRLSIVRNHVFFCLTDGYFRFSDENQDFTKSFVISMFGRLIDDKEIRRIAKERHSRPDKISSQSSLHKAYVLFMMFFANWKTSIAARKLEKQHISYENAKSSIELLNNFSKQYEFSTVSFSAHMNATFTSSIWNLPILTLLARCNGDWNNMVFSDFAYLLSTCTDILSAEVPAEIENLAAAILETADSQTFKKMETEEAIEWLQNNTAEVGLKYRQFLQNHGHRGIKEFDVKTETWEVNPRPLIATLQGLVDRNAKIKSKAKPDSYLTILSKLQIKLNFWEKLKLLWLLPNAHRAVRGREISKSLAIKMMQKLRLPLHHLAELMVKEGRIPRKELIFFLCVEELYQLIKTRSPRLVSKAIRRWKCHEELDKLIFPEITMGIPKPINSSNDVVYSGKGLTMTGIPISQGVVKATARVIASVEEAVNIQPGDILITYCTDIAWSPYFTLLAGVVTELGGLISHGAVVAREYGLPCVVGLHGATKAFKSGDLVVLDGNKGTLQRIEND